MEEKQWLGTQSYYIQHETTHAESKEGSKERSPEGLEGGRNLN